MVNYKTVLVCGCTRTGLTLTMQLLYYGGYPCAGSTPAFEDIPLLQEGSIGRIVKDHKGKAIKLVDTAVRIPPEGDYYVIRTNRDYLQAAKSNVKLLESMGFECEPDTVSTIAESIKSDYEKIDQWAKMQSGYIQLDFENTLKDPISSLDKISDLIGFRLNHKSVNCVLSRSPECANGFMENIFLTKEWQQRVNKT